MIKYKRIYKEIEARPVKSTAQNGRPEVNPMGGSGPRGKGAGAEAGSPGKEIHWPEG